MSFQRKGHTHIGLDGVFGQLTVGMVNSVWDTADECVDVLTRLLGTARTDPQRRINSVAYKLDLFANWEVRANNLEVWLPSLTGR